MMKKNSYKSLLVILIPSLYLVIGIYILQMTGIYSLRSIDPEYIYFISGLSVANGHLELGHIDNPGTPLQYFIALSFRIIYLFREGNIPFIEDALANSDMYLAVTNLFMTAFVSAFLYFAGRKALQITKSLTFSILIQITPFFTSIIYGNIGRVTPENFMPIPVILLSLFLLKIIKSETDPNSWKSNVIFASISAFGLALKLTFLPILIIPFIAISNWKKRLSYSLFSFLLFLVFALPVTLQLNTFWHWVKALFLNSGQYGTGEKTILDIKTFIPNFVKLWNANEIYFIIFLLLGLALVVNLFLNKSKKQGIKVRISIALISAIFVQIFIVCKHFEQRYFVAALFLAPLIIILIYEFTSHWHIQIKNTKVGYLAIYLFIIAFATTQVPIIRQLSGHLAREQEKRLPAFYYLKGVEKNAIKILVPGYYNCPSPEYALRFSYGWAGKQKVLYEPYLAKLFLSLIHI